MPAFLGLVGCVSTITTIIIIIKRRRGGEHGVEAAVSAKKALERETNKKPLEAAVGNKFTRSPAQTKKSPGVRPRAPTANTRNHAELEETTS